MSQQIKHPSQVTKGKYCGTIVESFKAIRKKVSTLFECEISGDSALNLVVSDEISTTASQKAARLAAAVRDSLIPGIVDVVPTYCSVMVCYDPCTLSASQLKTALEDKLQNVKGQLTPGKTVEIPVAYGGEFGPDLDDVAALAGMSPEEVIAIHSSVDYPIAMLGFLPGFPYLAGLDPRLYTSRLETPRTSIPRGSVGIGGQQTGIYPLDCPGGWRIIGRTPVPLFDSTGTYPIPYQSGDSIRFIPISEKEFYQIEADYFGVKIKTTAPDSAAAEKPAAARIPYVFRQA